MKYSKFGLVLSGLYLLITLIIIYQALTCEDMFCGMIVFLPVYPWVYLSEAIPFPKFLDSQFGLFFYALMNVLILYWAGSLLERWYKTSFKK